MDLDKEMDVALRAAQEAAALLESIYARSFTVQWKAPDDPVTEADRRANDALVTTLRTAFPADHICAEETDLSVSAREAAQGGRCWFIDPLDGTREFIRRSGEFCVMVGLAVEGVAVLGVVIAPIWQRTFAGVVGQGAYVRGSDGVRRALRAPVVDSPDQARLVLSRPHRNAEVDEAAARLGIRDIRECGSVGLKMMLVAAGEADLYLHTGPGPSLWDGCAPEAIARAAGAEVQDAAGSPLRYDTGHLPLDQGLVVAAPPLAALAVQALRASRRL